MFSTSEQKNTSDLFSVLTKKHTRNRPISRGEYEPSRLCKVYNLDPRDPVIRSIPRAGVLFYTFIRDELYLCFGKDAKTGDLTDFGGRKHKGESPIECAIREGNEESRHAFGVLETKHIKSFYCLYSSNMLIIFIPVASPDERDTRELTSFNFKKKQFLNKNQAKSRAYNEVNEIIWLDEAQLDNLFSPRPQIQLFAMVRRFIYSCTGFSQNVQEMKRILRDVISGETQKFETNELETRVQNTLATIGSEMVNRNNLAQWLTAGSYYSNPGFPEIKKMVESPPTRIKLNSSSELIPRRFTPEVRLAY